MDTFVEQIVAIKKTVKTWILYFVIAVFAIVLMTLVFYLPYTLYKKTALQKVSNNSLNFWNRLTAKDKRENCYFLRFPFL